MAGPHVSLIGAEFEENLSLRYLASAVAPDGVSASLLPFNFPSQRDGIVARVLAEQPICVGISVPFQVRAPEILGVASALRRAGYAGHITVGGHFATFEYENILRDFPAIDSVVRHEGEATFRQMCAELREQGSVGPMPGLVLRTSRGAEVGPPRLLPPLDELPFPDRRGEPHDVLGVRSSPLVGSRGCYADCSFCCIYAYAENARGARYRRRAPEPVVEEMYREYVERDVRLFIFHDDNFFLPYLPKNLERYRRFAELLRERRMDDIALVIKCRPNDVDPELFSLLKEIGLIRAYVGIETNSDEGIVSLNRRITSEDNRRALRILRELDIYCSFNVLIFDPEATLEGIDANLDFMQEHASTPYNFCRAEVYAGTPLQSILSEQKRLRGDYMAWGYQMRDLRVELMFRIFSTAFMTRNFKPDGVANLNMGIRFDNEVLRHFYPQCWDADWQERLEETSRLINLDSVARMRQALAFAAEVDLEDHAAIKTFTLDTARALARRDLELIQRVKGLRREMEARILRSGGHLSRNPYGPEREPWAAETGRLGDSVGRELSTELLPTPAQVAP